MTLDVEASRISTSAERGARDERMSTTIPLLEVRYVPYPALGIVHHLGKEIPEAGPAELRRPHAVERPMIDGLAVCWVPQTRQVCGRAGARWKIIHYVCRQAFQS